MKRELSEKIRVASFVATVLVVLRHSYTISAFYPAGNEPHWLNRFEWGTLFWTDVAVPFFFFVSGYFFMRHDYVADGTYFAMLRKKASTLLVPFVIWNVGGGLVLFFYDSEGNLGASATECLRNFVLSRWYGPLWYVRDLMLFMLAFPLYGWLYRRRLWPMLLLLIIYMMWNKWWPADVSLLSWEGIIFFLLGGLFQRRPSLLDRRPSAIIALLMLVVWVAYSFTFTSWERWPHRIGLLVGLPAFWLSLDLLPRRVWHFCRRLSGYSFLIYVTHFYAVKVLKVGLAYFLADSASVAFAAFFVIPVVIIAVTVVVGRWWRRLSSKTYSVCMGGRLF
ncbi:MAG: acyltransferase [Bacteroidales bacterium]|nr:acyltransferase [Bacteroidales bacterium]